MSTTAVIAQTYNATIVPTIRGPPATREQMIELTIVLSLLGLWSTFGNLLTIVAISLHKDMRTRSNMFILSLSISDLLSGSIASPLWLYRRTWGFNPWQWGQFACRLYWFMDETTSYCTALHIASFAVWRLIGVKFPSKLLAIKFRAILLWLGMLWTLSLLFGGIYCTYYEAIVKPQDGKIYSHWPMCSNQFRHNRLVQFKSYYNVASAIFLLAPMAILFIASLLIAYELLIKETFKSELRRSKERRAVTQLALISVSFLIGYIPMITYITWTTKVARKSKILDYWFGVAAYLSLRVSECVNPVMYNISSRRMREASVSVMEVPHECEDAFKW